MKNLLILAAIAMACSSCHKSVEQPSQDFSWQNSSPEEINRHYLQMAEVNEPLIVEVPYAYLANSQFDTIVAMIDTNKFWSKEDLLKAVPVGKGSDLISIDCDERYRILMSSLPGQRNSSEAELETIVRKNTGSLSLNGGGVFWDASPEGLAYLLTHIGEAQPLDGTLNYAKTGTSANRITFSDVLRAANGLANTSFDQTIEIIDVVYELQVSGDGNWLIGAVVSYNGEEYVYSNYDIPGMPALGPLVYDPQDGGVYIVGPMPGGIVSVNVTGQFEAPVVE
jgi:opacity protein-like surface antigen